MWNCNDYQKLEPTREAAIDAASAFPRHSYKAILSLIKSQNIYTPHGVSCYRFAAMIRHIILRHIESETAIN